ncbi:MAG TPA: transcription elongation factor GreA [Dehalococcoidia bacterium]|nr:transcription elongation factor GreA [Dehalococcoidia bacterium]
MADNTATLAEAVQRYTATLKPADQSSAYRELSRFLRWFDEQPGQKRSDELGVSELKIDHVTTYAELSSNIAGGMAERLQPLKSFLSYLAKQGLTTTNLAQHVRIRKTPTLKKQQAEVQPRSVVQLTASGHRDLVAELEQLRARIPEITDEVQRAAADKDFRENAPLQAAREEHSKIVGRIQELEGVLRSAEILDESAVERSAGRVVLGSTVLLHDLSHDEELRYTLVAGHEVDIRNGKLSVDSPTGRALLERREGDEVEVTAPLGVVRMRIKKIET